MAKIHLMADFTGLRLIAKAQCLELEQKMKKNCKRKIVTTQ